MADLSQGRSPFGLFILLMIAIAVLITLVSSAIFLQTSTPVPPTFTHVNTATLPLTLTPIPTSTPTRTPRPSWTLRPSEAATATSTPSVTQSPTIVHVATLASAKPLKYNDLYLLADWTPELADKAVKLIREYPDALFPKLEDRQSSAYHQAYLYPEIAYQEALLRFPDSPQAADWRWGLAYSQAHLGKPEAVEFYSRAIEETLAREDILPENLPEWFKLQEPRLSLVVHPLSNQPGLLSRLLVQIPEGGIYILLLENPDGVQVYPLTKVFDFEYGNYLQYQFDDVTGDAIRDVILMYGSTPGKYVLPTPEIYDISNLPPVLLSVAGDIPFDYGTDFQMDFLAVTRDGYHDLQVTARFYPACPVDITRIYHWNGSSFEYFPYQYGLQVSPEYVQFCQVAFEHAAAVWDPPAILALLEELQPYWPPKMDTNGRPFPPDGADQIKFYLGLYHALVGQQTEATRLLSQVANQPVIPSSRWIQPARQFLDIYQQPEDLYRACQSISQCNMHAALRQMVAGNPTTDPSLTLDALIRAGVAVRSSGYFDFDGDGRQERWFVVRQHPEENLEFWILASVPQGMRALYVTPVEVDKPEPYLHDPTGLPRIVQVELRKGFIFYRLPKTGEPYLVFVAVEPILTTYTRDQLLAAREALFSGTAPREVLRQLNVVMDSGHFNCKTHNICDQFYYILGLCYELTGAPRDAIDTYVQLWWENSKSPLTALARLKLIPIPTPTRPPTRTPTITLTPSITLTPTITRTPTQTVTGNPIASTTPTTNITPSPTPTPPTPYPPTTP